MKEILVQPTMRNGILSLLLLSSPMLFSTQAAPVPQAETKPAPPPNRPAQAQVMLAPSQVATAQLLPKEPMPTDTRNPDRILRVGHRGTVQALAFSPDRRWLASGGYDKVIILWNLSSGSEGRDVATFAENVAQMCHRVLFNVSQHFNISKWRKNMSKPRTERNLLFPSKEFRERVRKTSMERGFRSEQAFILAACEGEMRRSDNAD